MSRMDRYETSSVKERTEKNRKLYEMVTDIDVDYIDVNNATVIDNNWDNNNLTRTEYQQRKEIDKLIKKEPESEKIISVTEKNDDRIYDINEILKLARENKLFSHDDDKKRLINTEYNILTKLDISKIEEKDASKENLRELIDTIYGNSKTETVKETKKEVPGGLLDDLVEETVLSEETSKDILDKEISKTIILDKDDESSTKLLEVDKLEEKEDNSLIKLDEDKKEEKELDDEDDEDELDLELSKGRKALIFIIIVVVLILLAGAYLFYKYFL